MGGLSLVTASHRSLELAGCGTNGCTHTPGERDGEQRAWCKVGGEDAVMQ